jgi:predicted RNA-binding Zn-ribbon protein involved in translation (DUF1610 family)
MKYNACISCGNPITKSAFADPYVCRNCENAHGVEQERYWWLDNR